MQHCRLGASPLEIGRALRAWSDKLDAAFGPFARKVMSLSALTAAGQATFVIALPVLSRLYTPADFGIFTIYLSIVNIGGPIIGLKFESALYAGPDEERRPPRRTLLSFLTMIDHEQRRGNRAFLLRRPVGGTVRTRGAMDGCGYCRSVYCWRACGLCSSAWAIRSEAVSTLGMARFMQPAAMTALAACGRLVHAADGIVLIGAHLVSHLAYTTFIFWRTLNSSGISGRFARPMEDRAEACESPTRLSFVSRCPPRSAIWRSATCRPYCYRRFMEPRSRAIAASPTDWSRRRSPSLSLPLGAIFTGVVSRTPDSCGRRPARAQGVPGEPAPCILADLAVRRRRA